MASSAKQFSLFLLLITLLSPLHTHADTRQIFNKVPSTGNKNAVPNDVKEAPNNQQEQPNFLPDNGNSYGLYGHDTGLLPPSTTTGEPASTSLYDTETKQPVHKYLPKNYNTVAYVTEPEEVSDSNTFAQEKTYTTNPNSDNVNYHNARQNYYNSQQEEEETEHRSYAATTNNRDNNNYYYYNGGSSFNSQAQPQGLSDTRYRGDATLNRRERNSDNGFEPQGMSDTRSVGNGKYYYDINTGRYSRNHPYESLRGVGARNAYNNRNYYGNSENNGYELSSENSIGGGYQNQEEFQDEENYTMP
ncbi:protein E6 [Sesamum indicum]|uniref:Protein E6 n=1 Tax=Sesamum indicum TaxID=4182 RepID=A0A6I9UDT9_SESIN|nr:protein E6 [Sesamum indicum]